MPDPFAPVEPAGGRRRLPRPQHPGRKECKETTIEKGEVLIVDTSQHEPVEGQLFVAPTRGALSVGRLHRKGNQWLSQLRRAAVAACLPRRDSGYSGSACRRSCEAPGEARSDARGRNRRSASCTSRPGSVLPLPWAARTLYRTHRAAPGTREKPLAILHAEPARSIAESNASLASASPSTCEARLASRTPSHEHKPVARQTSLPTAAVCYKGGMLNPLAKAVPLLLAAPALLLAQAIPDRPFSSAEEALAAVDKPLYSNCEPVSVLVQASLKEVDSDANKAVKAVLEDRAETALRAGGIWTDERRLGPTLVVLANQAGSQEIPLNRGRSLRPLLKAGDGRLRNPLCGDRLERVPVRRAVRQIEPRAGLSDPQHRRVRDQIPEGEFCGVRRSIASPLGAPSLMPAREEERLSRRVPRQ